MRNVVVHETEGDLLEVKDGDIPTFLCHGVNTRGFMGAGIAKVFAENFPGLLDGYRAFIKTSRCPIPGGSTNLLGQNYVYNVSDTLHIVNMFTQRNTGADARLLPILQCIDTLLRYVGREKSKIFIPQIGCGIGGLHWDHTRQAIIDHITSFNKEAQRGMVNSGEETKVYLVEFKSGVNPEQ